MPARTLLVTGANRGIGLKLVEHAVADGWRAIATARRPADAQELNALASLTGKIEIVALDASSERSAADLADALKGRPLDLAVANAGVFTARGGIDSAEQTETAWREMLMTNVFGPFALARALRTNLAAAPQGKLAIIASMMGSSERAPGGSYAYRATKAAAVNLARNLATDFRSEGIAVGAYHPGWVRTQMGGAEADISVDESAAGLLARFEALSIEKTGVFEDYDGRVIPF